MLMKIGRASCRKRLMMDTKVCGQLTSNNTYFSDIWFSGVKTSQEAMSEGVDYCRPVKKIHKDFCLAAFKKVDKRLAGSVISCYEEYSKSSWCRKLMAIG